MPKTEDNIVLGNAGRFQFAYETEVRVVGLRPHFAVDDVKVRDDVIDAANAIPARCHDEIAIALSVEDGSTCESALGMVNTGEIVQHTANNLAISI